MSHETGQDATARRVGLRLDQYATLHGLAAGAVRKRIQRGQLDAHKGDDHRWYVLGPDPRDETGQDTRQDWTGPDATQDAPGGVAVNPSARAQLEAIRDEWLAPLVAQITDQARTIGRLEQERDELRRRAEAAEAERDALRGEAHDLRWLAAPVPPSATPVPQAQVEASAPPVAAQGFWQRVRRAFGGE